MMDVDDSIFLFDDRSGAGWKFAHWVAQLSGSQQLGWLQIKRDPVTDMLQQHCCRTRNLFIFFGHKETAMTSSLIGTWAVSADIS